MAVAKRVLKWTDTEDIAFRLIDQYPEMDPLRVRFTDLHKYITALPDFDDNPKKSNEKILEAIQMRWHEERADMEDELGPVAVVDEDLDEDQFPDDEIAKKEIDASEELLEEEDEDEDEDEFGDGFQEEEEV